jgi:glycosyltransferase involved in cell wall biosynthesis
MKVLIVCSGTHGILSPFVKEQMDSLAELGVEISLFQIQKDGIIGYLQHLRPLKKHIVKYKPDIIHTHYGFSGLLANLQRKVPVITTYHGSDINAMLPFFFSKFAILLSKHNIFVSPKLLLKAKVKKDYSIIPCGVNVNAFNVVDRNESRKKMNMDLARKYVLFSSAFSNHVKNYPLAKQAIRLLASKGYDTELIEFKGYSREKAVNLINAVDCILLTSFSEGSPQLVKETMACNQSIVATNVGDIAWLFGGTVGCYLTSFDPNDIAEKIKLAVEFNMKNAGTNGRERIIELGLDTVTVAKKILEVYQKIVISNQR